MKKKNLPSFSGSYFYSGLYLFPYECRWDEAALHRVRSLIRLNGSMTL